MYTLQNLKKLTKNPKGLLGVVHHLGMKANQFYYARQGKPDYVSMMDKDWDNLYILDGCRYDLFEETIDFDGRLESRRSPGSSSAEFIQSTFEGCTFPDTVYITANPHAFDLPSGTFHAMINVLTSDWDPELNTVPPDRMADAVRSASREYPEKRLVAHFMQPHYPFIGERGRKLKQGGIGRRDETGAVVDSEGEGDIWVKLQFRLDGVDRNSVWKGYRENLELVLAQARDLIEEIDGKTVLTADHGNLVGDWISPVPCRGYGHPPNLYVDELVQVPWFVVNGERREITAEPPERHDDISQDVVEDRLQSLGYKV